MVVFLVVVSCLLIGPWGIGMKFGSAISNLILVFDGWSISCENVIGWLSLDLTDDKSALVQVLALFGIAVRQQALTRINVDLVLCRYMASPDSNESKWRRHSVKIRKMYRKQNDFTMPGSAKSWTSTHIFNSTVLTTLKIFICQWNLYANKVKYCLVVESICILCFKLVHLLIKLWCDNRATTLVTSSYHYNMITVKFIDKIWGVSVQPLSGAHHTNSFHRQVEILKECGFPHSDFCNELGTRAKVCLYRFITMSN